MPKKAASESRAPALGEAGPGALSVDRRPERSPQDTGAGCDALAASDLARAALMDTENGRLKLQNSAESWQQRAELLHRLEAGEKTRKASDKSEWEAADAMEELLAKENVARDVRL